MSTSAVRAGSLIWDIDVGDQQKAIQRVEELGKRLDQVLNRQRSGASAAIDRTAEAAEKAVSRVDRLVGTFARLKAEHDAGLRSTESYTSRLNDLEKGLTRTTRQAGLTTAEYRKLSTTSGQVTRELGKIASAQDEVASAAAKADRATKAATDQALKQRIQALVNEVRVLRNEWQETGANTDATKLRLTELMQEMGQLRTELRSGVNGWEDYNAEIARLAVAGRSAQATINGMEGRMSRLGLASQVNLALQQQVTNQLYRYGPAGRIAASSLGLVGGGLGVISTGAMAAAGGVLALGAAGTALVRAGIPEVKAMQAALNVLIASGEDLDAVGLDRILRDVQEAAGSAGRQFARGEIATALAEIVKAGVEANDAVRLLAPGMQLAVVTGQDLNQATSNLLANLRQFGLETTEAGRAADALAAADLAAAHGAAELSEGLATVGPVANAAGMTLEDTLGILVELDNKGLDPADKGATALRGTLSALLDPTEKANGVLESLGIKLRDGEGKARPLLTILTELQQALKGNSEAAQNAAKIFDTRAVTAILNMTDKSNELADALRNSEGASKAYADQVTRNDLQKAQDALVTAWRDLGTTAATVFVPGLTSAATAVADFLREIDKLTNAKSFGEFMGILDPTYKGWDNMTLGARVRTVLGIPDPSWAGSGGRRDWTMGVWTGPDFDNLPAPFGPATMPEGYVPPTKDVQAAVEAYRNLATIQAELKAAQDALVNASGPAEEQRLKALVAALEEEEEARKRNLGLIRETIKAKRTVDDVFKDLETQGLTAKNAALALGNSLDAQLQAAETRAKLVNSAIAELMQRPDVNEGDNPDRLAYLVRRAKELEESIERLKLSIATLDLPERDIAQVPEGSMSIAGVNVTPPTDPAAQQALKDLLANWEAGQKAVDAYNAALAVTNSRLDLGLINSEGELSERLTATRSVINSMLPLWPQLSDEHKAFVEQAIRDATRLEQQLEINAAQAEQQAQRRQNQRERDIQTQLERDDDNATAEGGMTLEEIKAWVTARREAEAEAAKQRRLAENARRQEALNVQSEAHTLGVRITAALRAGSMEGLQELEQTILDRLNEYGDSVLGALFSGLLTQVRAATARLNEEAEAEARAAAEMAARLALNARRAETMAIQRDAHTLGVQVGTAIRQGSIDALKSLEAELVEKIKGLGDDPIAALYVGVLTELRAGLKPLQDAASTTVESLQWQLVELRTKGAEPSSAAIQELVRRINELQLKAALEELRAKGVKNLSAFARAVLEANGILPKTVAAAKGLSQTLRDLGGNDVADGLAGIIDGINGIKDAAGDAEKTVAALTLMLEGATKIVNGLADGDTFETLKNTASIIGEGIGMAAGIPGVGQAVAAVFDLGRAIVDAISDVFTGDSPAARAIRDGLAGAVQSAFTTGILAALQKGENWRENLREGAKLAFLTALIEAFVKSTIVTAVMEPIMYAYSKMLAKGQYDAAAEYLASALPAAINTAMSRVDDFVSSLPAGLIPTQPGSPPPPNEPTGLFELPTATVSGIAAPDWARDLVNAGRVQMEASKAFAAAVDLLVSQGITVKASGSGSSSVSAAAAARAA